MHTPTELALLFAGVEPGGQTTCFACRVGADRDSCRLCFGTGFLRRCGRCRGACELNGQPCLVCGGCGFTAGTARTLDVEVGSRPMRGGTSSNYTILDGY